MGGRLPLGLRLRHRLELLALRAPESREVHRCSRSGCTDSAIPRCKEACLRPKSRPLPNPPFVPQAEAVDDRLLGQRSRGIRAPPAAGRTLCSGHRAADASASVGRHRQPVSRFFRGRGDIGATSLRAARSARARRVADAADFLGWSGGESVDRPRYRARAATPRSAFSVRASSACPCRRANPASAPCCLRSSDGFAHPFIETLTRSR